MTQNAATVNPISPARQRVRTPGKYLVLFTVAIVSVISFIAYASTKMIEQRSAVASLEFRKDHEGARTAYFPLPEFLIDLAPDRNGRTTYLKMRAIIQLSDMATAETARQLEAAEPAIRERLTFFLRELQPEDFDGSEDMVRIKRELLRRVNIVIAPAEAADVIVEEIVIQ
ncbi:MAG: hypothetical protein HKN14_00105 [Marinicaulis sp.]|nr:flagellar basal body-associated FliL family protein [Marinicaulis sp.]NNE39298.1 hypothetical protein [Marinicaulis sp.]NNL90026.1 hypothetical protein [Marinicaulis sp.]